MIRQGVVWALETEELRNIFETISQSVYFKNQSVVLLKYIMCSVCMLLFAVFHILCFEKTMQYIISIVFSNVFLAFFENLN